jgi:hypothetical protein
MFVEAVHRLLRIGGPDAAKLGRATPDAGRKKKPRKPWVSGAFLSVARFFCYVPGKPSTCEMFDLHVETLCMGMAQPA